MKLIVHVLLAIALSVSTELGSPAANDRPHFAPQATDQTYFTPGDDCEGLIERAINAAVRRIHLQAYLFTDRNNARRRGLEVIVLLDKRQRRDPESVAPELAQAGVEIMFDDQPRIAHNKTFVIDPEARTPSSRPEATISPTAPSAATPRMPCSCGTTRVSRPPTSDTSSSGWRSPTLSPSLSKPGRKTAAAQSPAAHRWTPPCWPGLGVRLNRLRKNSQISSISRLG